MKKTETEDQVVQNLELYKDYLKKYEDGKWAQQIQQLAQNVTRIDKDNQTEEKDVFKKKKEVLKKNTTAMDDIVDELPPEFFLLCKIVDGINREKNMNILLFPQEANHIFQEGHRLYESVTPNIESTYNDKCIQHALKAYGELLKNKTPCAIIYVTHHKYLCLHCETAVHYVDKKNTQKILATNLEMADGCNSFDETLYEKAINLTDENKSENPHNDKSSSSTKPETITFIRNHQTDFIGCVINAIKFATSALKNIKKHNNLISPEDFNNQKESIQTFLNDIVPDDKKSEKIKSVWDIEMMFKEDVDTQQDTKKHILWLEHMYKYFNLDYDSKENKLEFKDFPEKIVSSGYRKYNQRNKKYLSSIGINKSKLNQIYLKDNNGKEWNVGTFLKLKTLVQKYLEVDRMDVRDNIVMALSGTRSMSTIKTPSSFKYYDIEKKWYDNNKDKQVKQKKEIKNKKNDGNSKDNSKEENNIKNSENNTNSKEKENEESKKENNKTSKVKDKEKDSKKGKNGNGNQNKKDSNKTSKVNITTKEQMKHNLLEDYNNVISIKEKELKALRAKQSKYNKSKYNNKKGSLNKPDFFQKEIQKEIRKKKEELITTKKLKHQLELTDINFI